MATKQVVHNWEHKDIPPNEIKVLEMCTICGLFSWRYKGARTYMNYNGEHLPYRPTCSPGKIASINEVIREDLMKPKDAPYEFMKHKEPEKPIKPFGGPGDGRGRFSGREAAKADAKEKGNKIDWDKVREFVKKGGPAIPLTNAVPEDPNKPDGPWKAEEVKPEFDPTKIAHIGMDTATGKDINAMAMFYEGKVIGKKTAKATEIDPMVILDRLKDLHRDIGNLIMIVENKLK